MYKALTKLYEKVVLKQWRIGIFRGSIQDIIINKEFNYPINWLKLNSPLKFIADPFLISEQGGIKILCEEFKLKENYGKIALLTLNSNFKKINKKNILDTKSHLSYPFVFKENGRYYVFPEAASSGRLSCYEYEYSTEQIKYIKDVLDVPLLDPTILNYNNKYWLLGTIGDNRTAYKLYIFFSDNLLGPYLPHALNPVKTGLDAVRSAGSFIVVHGEIYMPTQNCAKIYGDSITINKITQLTENEIVIEEHMVISLEKNKFNHRMHSIHTINVINDIIVVDGQKSFISLSFLFWRYSRKIKLLFANKSLLKE